MIRHNKCALHHTLLIYIYRKFGRGIKLNGNRIKEVGGNKEIGMYWIGREGFTVLESEPVMFCKGSLMSYALRMFIHAVIVYV